MCDVLMYQSSILVGTALLQKHPWGSPVGFLPWNILLGPACCRFLIVQLGSWSQQFIWQASLSSGVSSLVLLWHILFIWLEWMLWLTLFWIPCMFLNLQLLSWLQASSLSMLWQFLPWWVIIWIWSSCPCDRKLPCGGVCVWSSPAWRTWRLSVLHWRSLVIWSVLLVCWSLVLLVVLRCSSLALVLFVWVVLLHCFLLCWCLSCIHYCWERLCFLVQSWMLLGSTLSWSGLLVGCSFTSPWVVPNSLLVGLTVLVTVSLWTVLVAVLDSLLAGPINVLVTISLWTVLSKLLVLLRSIPLIFLLWFLLILLLGRTLAYRA